ncbi:MAG: putative DNA binding domain-containing protein [Bacteroidetes bacterium]|nr:putative DNA binding domain-containing protein [Bacteroidota bacterium]
MITKTELLELINHGENSYVEFKRDSVKSSSLGKEICAICNEEGGIILLGVEDDGQISGITRTPKEIEEWIMNIARDRIQPAIRPRFMTLTVQDSKSVAIIKFDSHSQYKPYRARTSNGWITYVRTGSTSREATREELIRLFQSAGLVTYETNPVPNMGLESLDMSRLSNYFEVILTRSIPEPEDTDQWQQLLLNCDLLTEINGCIVATVAAMLLFGKNPNRRVPQAGITAVAFSGTDKDYNTIDEEQIRGPLVARYSDDFMILDKGVIDRSVDFVERNLESFAWLDGARRVVKKSLPLDAVREAIINAVTHRDYTYEGTDIELAMYVDRVEIISPGKLPNGVTITKMKEGIVRATRNGLIKDILRDYRYVDNQGMGVRNKMIKLMFEHCGTEPDLLDEGHRFKVCFWKPHNPHRSTFFGSRDFVL